MPKSRLSNTIQDRLLEHFVAGTTARCSASLLSINNKSSAYYCRRLREIILYHLELESEQCSSRTGFV